MVTHTSIQNIERPSLREQVYQSIKTAIITLELEPGQKIRDQDLAAKFNVSRTPVREALRRLEDEELVVSTPGSVTRVAMLDAEEVKQAFIVVTALHSLAARLAVPELKDEDFASLTQINADLEDAMSKGNVMQAVEADDCFHDVFITVSGNKEISTALAPVTPKVRRLEFAKFSSLNGGESVDQHNQIISASKRRDSKIVSVLVEQNWLSLGTQLTNESFYGG